MDPLQPAAAPVNLVALGYRALHDPRGRTYLVNTLARSAVVTSSAAPWESEAGWSPVSGGALVPVLAAAGCPMAVARLEAACAA